MPMGLSAKAQQEDLSSQAVNRNVVLSTLEHPAVLAPAAIGGLGLAGLLLIEPSLIMMSVAGIGSLVAAGVWATNIGLRRDYFAKKYVEEITQKMNERRRMAIKELSDALENVGFEHGQNQFKRSQQKFDTFKSMLDKKLNPSELTHVRYLGMAEQVYLSTLDNLIAISHIMHSISVIDADYVEERLDDISSDESAESGREVQALKERLALKDQQQDKVKKLLSQNEEALTKMDLTIAAIAEMRTDNRQASMDMESAMGELGRLAKRAKDYEV